MCLNINQTNKPTKKKKFAEDLKTLFSQKDIQMTKRYMKRCPTSLIMSVQFSSVSQSCPTLCNPRNHRCQASLIITEIQIKTTMKYHLTAVKITIIKKSTNNKCWRVYGEKGTLLHCWQECKLIQPLWTTVRRVLKKLKTQLPYDPEIQLLGIYPGKNMV